MNYNRPYAETQYIKPPKKVKHVHFIHRKNLINLENDINAFADNYPDRKILGIRLTVADDEYIATITYLENCSTSEDDWEED